ncbi:MAG: hypothetical protein V3R28_03635, partial [Desulfatiglandales bacterium]
TKAIGDAIYYATRYMDGKRTLGETVNALLERTKEQGLDVLGHRPAGDYAEFRGLEFAAAINRLRTFSVLKTD